MAGTFDLNMEICSYVVSQICDEEEFETTVHIHQGQLYLRVHGVNMSLEMETLCKSKNIFKYNFLVHLDCNLFQIGGIMRSLPVQLDHIVILDSGFFFYTNSNYFFRKMCCFCGNIIAVITHYKHIPIWQPHNF